MLDNFMTKRNKIIIIVLCVIVALILIFYQIFNFDKKSNNINIVTSSSKFYTVSNCVSRFISYLNANDSDSIYLLLDSAYKKKNNISINNVLDNIGRFDNYYSFQATKMFQEELDSNITKYYVKGYLSVEDIDYSSNRTDYYLIVTLDTKNSTYSVIPYDGEIFDKEEYNEK